MTAVPHVAYPLTMGNGGFVQVEQDTADEIAQCVTVLCLTELGQRMELPAYGIDDPAFTRHIDAPEVAAAIGEWEPRAVVDVNAVDGDIASLVIGLLTQ